MGLPVGGAEAVVIGLLAEELPDRVGGAVKVGQRAARPQADPYVQVVRTGGAMLHRVIDRAQLTVTVWSDNEVRAEQVARYCRDILAAATRIRPDRPRIARVEVLSLYYDEDPETGSPRYSMTVIVSVRAT